MTIISTQLFIALEGIDGAGKTEQVRRLSAALADRDPDHNVQTLREPGSTATGEAVRQLLAQHHHYLDSIAELFLLAAAHRQMAIEHVMPWLHQVAIIIADRYSASTMAYQYVDIRRRLKTTHQEIDHILADVDGYATMGIRPGLNVLLDPDDDSLAEIISRQDSGPKRDTEFLQGRRRPLPPVGRTKPSSVGRDQHLSILRTYDEIHHDMPEGAFDDLPIDEARNYKHYLYGWPKEEAR